MGVAARREGLRADENDFEAAAELIEQLGVIAFLLVKGLEEAGRTLQNFAGCGIAGRSERCRDHTALRREADAEPLGQRRRHRAVAGDGGAAKGDAEGVVHAVFVQVKNFSATGRGGEWTEGDSARVHRFRIGRQAETDAEIDAEANRGDKIFAGNFADFLRQREGGGDYRDGRFISDAVVVDIELAAVAHGGVDQRRRSRGQSLAGDEDRAFIGSAAQSLRAGERLLDPRRAGAGENRSEGVKDMFLGRAQRVVIERVETGARQIAGDLFCQCAAADHQKPLKSSSRSKRSSRSSSTVALTPALSRRRARELGTGVQRFELFERLERFERYSI